jgi:hypothetical protein
MRFSQLKVIAAVNGFQKAEVTPGGIGAYGRASRAAIKARQNAWLNNAR